MNLGTVQDQKLEWIEDTRRRADVFGEIVSRGISAELMKLIACLYLEKKSRSGGGRKFGAADEKLLTSAERMKPSAMRSCRFSSVAASWTAMPWVRRMRA